jgi:zinc transporter ZupT
VRFGTYDHLARWKKLVLQLSGSVGTPIALLVGWWVLGDAPLLSALCLAGALAVVLMQISVL